MCVMSIKTSQQFVPPKTAHSQKIEKKKLQHYAILKDIDYGLGFCSKGMRATERERPYEGYASRFKRNFHNRGDPMILNHRQCLLLTPEENRRRDDQFFNLREIE